MNSKDKRGHHPATFPEGLVKHCIKVSGIKEGIVMDPFVGSGTTVRVIKKMNEMENSEYKLKGVGIDMDKKYIDYCNSSIV